MKRAFIAATTLAAALTAAVAVAQDTPARPPSAPVLKSVCTNGHETATFFSTIALKDDPQTGEFGLTYMWMSMDDYNTMFKPLVFIVPDEPPAANGLQRAGIGELSVAVKLDDADNLAVIRAPQTNIRNILNTYMTAWKCDTKLHNVAQPQPKP